MDSRRSLYRLATVIGMGIILSVYWLGERLDARREAESSATVAAD